jgi:orotidine-5'-phosphate decarboxylase
MAELIVALDFPDRTRALALVDSLGDSADFFKVGLELFTSEGPEFVRTLREMGKRVFLDLKFHDIPNTVAASVAAAARLDVDLLTIHASGGSAMIVAARAAAEGSRTSVVAVTALTSLSGDELALAWGRDVLDPAVEVTRLARLAMEGGAHGIVASAQEVKTLRRSLGSTALIVTPGIRLPGSGLDDQVRVASPYDAVSGGANYLVVGRPITQASDPIHALERVRAAMEVG